ncbi:acid phosphatase [Mycolicibacterium confluentis]|uniref:Acid phosphatase n=1 Tax=Mycolicibacterium confluentis TaxID=28047 RepID=A0A7I7Y107_9MYCO|nr:acid phosphatase [Mycolicibacterium confluentis]MCV7319771.1 acid phosphatase [Mycolicibacterium confluentis]ORV34354.1 acid phosphatase [Mycolicibacterium confluentis]BBZ34801.1 acid phosphatase [Mycolicibacterium confluentis]
MSVGEHRLVLLRHGETEWSKSGQHTSTTDLDLTEYGREQAGLAALAVAHLGLEDAVVFSSPRRRALATAELAGLTVSEVLPGLAEWDYGDYEGQTTHDIRTQTPGWLLWTHGCPGGESVSDVSRRADAAIELALDTMRERDVVFVGHGHFSRSIVTRWVEQPLSEGARYGFGPASLAVCGFDYGLRQLKSLGLTAHRVNTETP